MKFSYPDFPRISIDTEVCFGKPCINGTRMPVASILAYLSGGMSIEEFLQEFNWLTKEDVLQALAFASLQLEDRFIPFQKAA